MNKIAFCLLLFLATTTLLAQNTEIDKRNGFKDIKLGALIDSVKGATLKKEIQIQGNIYPSELYIIEHPDYTSIGGIKIKEIQAITYRHYIYELNVITEKDTRLMKAMESVLGQASYDPKGVQYYWKGENLILTFDSNSKKELRLVYKSYRVPEMMKADKEKKIEKIADDF